MRLARVTARLLAGALVGLLLLVPAGVSWGEGAQPETHNPAADYGAVGNGYCFANTLVIAGIVIGGNRCYNFYTIRTAIGNFLGFGPPGVPLITPGQIIRWNTPAGANIRARMLYMVPLPGVLSNLSVNTAQFVNLRVGMGSARGLIFTVPSGGQNIELGVAQR